MRGALVATAVVVAFAARPAAAPVTRCAECHFANFSQVPAPDALVKWDQSAHARHGVGCDRCHGGDPTTYQPVDAHRGVLGRRHPLSSVNPANLALTCATCHAGVAAAFKLSGHAAAGASAGPTCTSCHGAMAAQVLSVDRLDATCRRCHGSEATGADYPSLARSRLDALRAIEQTLSRLETAIEGVDNRQKRNRLAAELILARAALRTAIDAVHTFDFRVMDEQRGFAQRRTSELVAALMASD